MNYKILSILIMSVLLLTVVSARVEIIRPSAGVGTVNVYTGNLTNVSQMEDVHVPTPTDGYVFTWNSTTGVWEAQVIGAGNNASVNNYILWVNNSMNNYVVNYTGEMNNSIMNYILEVNATNFQVEVDPMWTANWTNVAFTNIDETFDENLLITKNLSVGGNNISLGSVEGDSSIWFYDNGGLNERLWWDESDGRFELTDDFSIGAFQFNAGGGYFSSSLISQADISTTGSGDDLWLGNSTQADALFRAYANGSLFLKDISSSENITTQSYFVGNGSFLTDVSLTEADPMWTANWTSYYTSSEVDTEILTNNNSVNNYILWVNNSMNNYIVNYTGDMNASVNNYILYVNSTNLVGISGTYANDTYVNIEGDTMTGDLDMNDNNIYNVSNYTGEKINVTCCVYLGKLQAYDGNSIHIQPTGDEDDYFSFKTVANRPTIKREGGKFIYFDSSNVYDVGISLRDCDTYSGTLNYEKDEHKMTLLGKNSPVAIKTNSEYVNYFMFETFNHQPEISVFNGTTLIVNDSLNVIVNITSPYYCNSTNCYSVDEFFDDTWAANYSSYYTSAEVDAINTSVSNTIQTDNSSVNNYIVNYTGEINNSVANYILYVNSTNFQVDTDTWEANYTYYYNKTQIDDNNASVENTIQTDNSSVNNYILYVNGTNFQVETDPMWTANWTSYYTKTEVDAINTSVSNTIQTDNSSVTNIITTNNVSINNWVTSLAYATTTYVDTLIASIGNWTADKASYYTKTESNALNTSITNYILENNNSVQNTIQTDNSSMTNFVTSNNASMVPYNGADKNINISNNNFSIGGTTMWWNGTYLIWD